MTGDRTGFAHAFASRLGALSDAPREYLEVAALWALGVACRKAHVRAYGDRHRGNLYVLLVGPPFALRKSWTIARACSVLALATADASVRRLSGWSIQALLARLQFSDLDLVIGEFRQLAAIASAESGPAMLAAVNDLWCDLPSPIELCYLANPVRVPAGRTISILSSSTPEWLHESGSAFSLRELRASGLLSRLTVAWPSTSGRPTADPLAAPDEAGLRDAEHELAALLVECRASLPDDGLLAIEPASFRVLADAREHATAPSTARVWAQALRFALLLAVSDCSPAVTAEHARSGLALAARSAQAARRLAYLAIPFRATCDAVLSCLAAHPDHELPLPALAREIDADPAEIERAVRHLATQGEVARVARGPTPYVALSP